MTEQMYLSITKTFPVPPILVPTPPPDGAKPEHPIYLPVFPPIIAHPIVPSPEHPIYLPPNNDLSPEHPIYLPVEPPLGFWGGVTPPYVDIAPPEPQPPQPPAGVHPAPPIYLPVAPSHPIHIEVGPEHPIYIPIIPPAVEGGVPTQPIYIEIRPEHPIAPGGGYTPVFPAHPIVLPEPPAGGIPGLKPEHPIILPPTQPPPQQFYLMVADPATHQYKVMSFVPGGKPPTGATPKR